MLSSTAKKKSRGVFPQGKKSATTQQKWSWLALGRNLDTRDSEEAPKGQVGETHATFAFLVQLFSLCNSLSDDWIDERGQVKGIDQARNQLGSQSSGGDWVSPSWKARQKLEITRQ